MPQADCEFHKLSMESEIHPTAKIGKNCAIRSGAIIYHNVVLGDNVRTGHRVLIRENTKVGNNTLIGTNVVIEGDCVIGNNVSLQSNVYIPKNCLIEDFAFLGPNVVITNDKYPIREKLSHSQLKGAIIRKGASIGANSTILPGVEIGQGAMIGAGSVVTRDVSPWIIVAGNPAKKIKKVPKKLRVLNKIL